ncbi:hypothetical protein BD769DRAFT_1102518 [Suillus cothurnatus]|nr:hypothetical protein BD769DRAFT_1102518 [Suillus cothurnatus]
MPTQANCSKHSAPVVMFQFDTATWTKINDEWFPRPGPAPVDIVISPNQRILASIEQGAADTQCLIQLWNLETHQPIGPPLHYEDEDKGELTNPTFAVDGNFFVTGSESGRIHAWDVSAIVTKAGFHDLLTAKAVKEPSIDANATQRRAPKIEGVRRIPPGFFDDESRRVNSSTSRGHDTAAPRESTQPGRSASHNPLSLVRNFISGMLRRRDGSAIWLSPVEVPLTAGKPRNYHARKKPSASSSQPPKPPTTQQQNGGASQSNLPSSQQPPVTATAARTSHPDITIKRTGWRARFLRWVCCVPAQQAGS